MATLRRPQPGFPLWESYHIFRLFDNSVLDVAAGGKAKRPNAMPSNLIDLIREDKELTILLELPDRIILRVPLNRIDFDLELQGRSRAPKIASLIRDTKDDQPLYNPIIWIEQKDGKLIISVVDGFQRIAALRTNRKTFAYVQYFPRWTTRREAFLHGGTAANAIRYDYSQSDYLKIAAQSGMTVGELECCTNLSRSQAERFIKVARYPELAVLVERNLITVSLLSSLTDSCDNDLKRLERLIKSLLEKAQDSLALSQAAKTELKQRKGQKVDGSLKRAADERSYWRGVDWTSFKLNLEDGNEVSVEKATGQQMIGVRAGGRADWKNGILPLWVNGPPLARVTTEDLQNLKAQLPEVMKNLDVVINERLDSERKFPADRDSVRKQETRTSPTEQGVDDLHVNSGS
jgi:hypothetical protein